MLIREWWDHPLILNERYTNKWTKEKRIKLKPSKNKGKKLEEILGNEKAKDVKNRISASLKGHTAANKGIPRSKIANAKSSATKMGHRVLQTTRDKISKTLKNNPMISENQKGSNNSCYDPSEYQWIHPIYGERKCSRYELKLEYPELSTANLGCVARKEREHHKQWRIK